jgi:hypothetical protein
LQNELKQTKSQLSSSQTATLLAITDRNTASAAEAELKTAFCRLLERSAYDQARYKHLIDDSRKKLRTLQMQNLRSTRSRAEALDKAKNAEANSKKKSNWSLIEKGRYTPAARAIARVLDKAGCAQGKVASVISYIAGQAGLKVKGCMSRRTVQRALIEGGVAARIQLAHETADAAEGTNFFYASIQPHSN